jgi:hypothetical protein
LQVQVLPDAPLVIKYLHLKQVHFCLDHLNSSRQTGTMKKTKTGKCRLQMVESDPGIYLDSVSGTYHWRPVVNGKRTSKSFKTTQIGVARLLYAEIKDNQRRVDQGLTPAEKVKARLLVTEALSDYEKSGFASRRGGEMVKPGESQLLTEKLAVVNLNEHFIGAYCDELKFPKIDKYKEWRVAKAKKISHVAKDRQGLRQVDLDLNALSKALDCAVRNEKLDENRMDRTRFYIKGKARKTKVVCPDTPELFWKAGELLFDDRLIKGHRDPTSIILGWQWMWEGINGMRTWETINPPAERPIFGGSWFYRQEGHRDCGQLKPGRWRGDLAGFLWHDS